MTTLDVQKSALLHNYEAIGKLVKVPVIPVLKGNAYGLGDVEIASALSQAGVGFFAVSRIEEAEHLAAVLPDAEILLLSSYSTQEDAEKIINLSLTAAVGSYDSAVLLSGLAEKSGVRCRVHLVFDTGMGRFGFLPEETDKAVQAAKYLKGIEVTGCFTHLSNCFGRNKKGVMRQLALFQSCIAALREAGIDPGMTHIANTTAALLYPELRLDAVRVGSGLLGRICVRNRYGLERVGKLCSQVCEVRWLPAKHNIGYANTYRTKKPMKIALIPVGYADGLLMEKSKDTFRFRDILRYGWHDFQMLFGGGRPFCEIGGKRAPLLGRVGMCSVVADVSDIDCKPGDTAAFAVNPIHVNANVQRRYF